MNPFKISIIAAISFISLLAADIIGQQLSFLSPDPMRIWLISSAILLFYVILSSIYCFSTKERLQYYRQATIAYILLGIFTIGTAQFFSETKLQEALSHQWIILVISVVYLIFMTIIAMIRKIVDIAVNQDKSINNEN